MHGHTKVKLKKKLNFNLKLITKLI